MSPFSLALLILLPAVLVAVRPSRRQRASLGRLAGRILARARHERWDAQALAVALLIVAGIAIPLGVSGLILGVSTAVADPYAPILDALAGLVR